MALILSGDTGPSFVQAAAMPAGSVIQTISMSSSTLTTATSTTPVATALTLTITPSSTSSKILIMMSGGDIDNQDGGRQAALSFHKNGTYLFTFADNYSVGGGNRLITPVAGSYLDAPATTSATTYAIYVWSETNNTVKFNSQSDYATLTLMEIKG